MKIKILAIIAVAVQLAIAVNGQGAGGAGAAPATSGSAINPGVNVNGSIVTPANPNQGNVQLAPPVNPNTPIVGQGMGANTMTLGSNNLGMGTNTLRLGSNQFALRTNGLGTNLLTPTGLNGSRVLSNNIPVNPAAGTNFILLQP